MKTTVEQRAELRRLADSRSVLKWSELIDLLDDFATLEEENANWERWRGVARTERDALEAKIAKLEAEREQMLEALSRYEDQVQKLKEHLDAANLGWI